MVPRQTPATYFLTSATGNRRGLFQFPTNAQLFLETFNTTRAEGHYHPPPT